MLLVVAATPEELRGAGSAATCVCGVGPVEAAAHTALALAKGVVTSVLHVGIAGSRTFDGQAFLAIGTEARYCDADDPKWVELCVPADARLVEAAQRALPEARTVPIGTSARVGGATACEIEAMEGYAVLRAAALAGVPAVEVRAVSNAVGEPDRSRWRFAEAKDALAGALPRLLEELRDA